MPEIETTFPAEYVRSLRNENARLRRRLREQEERERAAIAALERNIDNLCDDRRGED